jgi:CrcB protein
MPDWLRTCLLLAAGGGAGTLARYWLGRGVAAMQKARWPELEFPIGTFLINVLGSLALGVLAALFLNHPDPSRRNWYLLLGTGFCGGFTTFSTFSLEAYELLRDERWIAALVYVVGSVAAGVLAVWFAVRVLPK